MNSPTPINAKKNAHLKFPPNRLKEKIGHGGFDDAQIERATEIVAKYVAEFDDRAMGITQELDKCIKKLPLGSTVEVNPMLFEKIYKITHDLKGEGATFGHPVISIISGYLLTYLDRHSPKGVNSEIIKNHGDAMLTILKHGIKETDSKIVKEICSDLQKLVKTK